MPNLPTDKQVIDFLEQQPEMVAKRDLCRRFSIHGASRRAFKDQLQMLFIHKKISKKGRYFGNIILSEDFKKQQSIYHKHIKNSDNDDSILMVVVKQDDQFFARPCERHIGDWLAIHQQYIDQFNLRHNMLVRAHIKKTKRYQYHVIIHEVIQQNHGLYHDIFLRQFDIRQDFDHACLMQAATAMPLSDDLIAAGYHDLRQYPFVTIDGADAKDFDDAVYCQPLDNGKIRAYIAIADVSLFVPENSSCDREAYLRGNSVYLANMVVPMLPYDLSNNTCSLRPYEDRACLVMQYDIDKTGYIDNFICQRAVITSQARIIYDDLQYWFDHDAASDFMDLPAALFHHLQSAYHYLHKARQERSALEIHSKEYKIIVDSQQNISDITIRKNDTTHKIIEELMIGANIAAATLLNQCKIPFLSRIHEQPSSEKCDFLSAILRVCTGIKLQASDVVSRKKLNQLLSKTKNDPQTDIINDFVLRSQMQALYACAPQGHFGLGLDAYTHFTSPIRRYSDLLIHRLLIKTLKLPQYQLNHDDKSDPKGIHDDAIDTIGTHLSQCERNAIACERAQMQSLMIMYMHDNIIQDTMEYAVLSATISGLSQAGLFVKIDQFGCEAFIPKSKIQPRDYYRCHHHKTKLIGRHRHAEFIIGQKSDVTIVELNPFAQNCICGMIS